MARGWRVTIAVTLVTAFAAAPASAKVSIDVLSNRAETVSGGDALIAVNLPKGTKTSRVRVSLNGKSVTGQFAVAQPGASRGCSRGCATA